MKKWMKVKKLGLAASVAAMALSVGFSGSAFARDSLSTRMGTGIYPQYWIAYEEPFKTNVPLTEARWQANIDWVASTLAPYGYKMVTTDGWLDGSTKTNANGYLLSYNDSWAHDWQYWVNYAESKGLKMGVYYNPLWVTQGAINDPNKKVIGTNIPISNIVTGGVVDVTKTGAKEFVQGYVKYFKNMGIKYLRIDFLGWYESGTASGAPAGTYASGSQNYATALQWMNEAAGDDMELSFVMPNLYNHGDSELKNGDLIRIDMDVTDSGWTFINQGSFGEYRQTWKPFWSQWANPFQGFTGFSDISGRGGITLDGDFFRLNKFSGTYADNEKRTAISLFTMAGSPISIADQYDSIGNNLPYFTNSEILALTQEGFVGKPIYYNGNPFEPTTNGAPDTGSRDSERWIGQTANGDWVVALFNRSDAAKTQTIDFASILGLSSGGTVRDLWTHADLGLKTSHTVTLNPHDVSMIRIKPQRSDATINRYEAEVGTYRGGAHFNNNHTNRSGEGFVDKLGADTAGANVVIGVNADTAGTYNLAIRYANGSGQAGTGSFKVTNVNNTQISAGALSLPVTSSWDQWSTVNKTVTLAKGLNLITIARNAGDTGGFNLDYVELNNRTDSGTNPGTDPGTNPGTPTAKAIPGQLEAENYDGMSGIQVEDSGNGGKDVGHVDTGDWMDYKVNVQTAGTYKADFQVASINNTGKFNVKLDGNVIGTVSVPNTGGWQTYTTVSTNLNLPAGEHTLRIECSSMNYNLDWMKFSSVSTPTPVIEIPNGGFEAGNISNWTEWHPQGQAAAYGVDSYDVSSGNYKLYFYNGSSAFKQSVHQVVSVPNGTYTISASVKLQSFSGTAPAAARMELGNYGGNQVNVNIAPGSSYQTISGTITVTNGQFDVGFYLDAAANTSLQIDNVKVTK